MFPKPRPASAVNVSLSGPDPGPHPGDPSQEQDVTVGAEALHWDLNELFLLIIFTSTIPPCHHLQYNFFSVALKFLDPKDL